MLELYLCGSLYNKNTSMSVRVQHIYEVSGKQIPKIWDNILLFEQPQTRYSSPLVDIPSKESNKSKNPKRNKKIDTHRDPRKKDRSGERICSPVKVEENIMQWTKAPVYE
jgi:hypothetical protein